MHWFNDPPLPIPWYLCYIPVSCILSFLVRFDSHLNPFTIYFYILYLFIYYCVLKLLRLCMFFHFNFISCCHHYYINSPRNIVHFIYLTSVITKDELNREAFYQRNRHNYQLMNTNGAKGKIRTVGCHILFLAF